MKRRVLSILAALAMLATIAATPVAAGHGCPSPGDPNPVCPR